MFDTSSRRKRLLRLFLAALVLASFVATAHAGPNANARIALHLLPVQPGGACTNPAALTACDGIVTAGRTQPTEYFAYLLVTNGDATSGIAGLQFGIDYDGTPNQGVDIFYWANCATLQFPMPNWPNAASGNLITWNSASRCQRTEPGGPGTGVVAVAGYFYLAAYTPDVLRITPRPVDGIAKVADCTAVEDFLEGGGIHHDPSFLGQAAFSSDGLTPGYNPCATVSAPCTISGPTYTIRGSSGNYFTTPSMAGTQYAWSVTGSAAIVGAADQPNVEVQAGQGSSFTIHLTTSVAGAVSTCSRDVSVQAATCSVSGPNSVLSGATATYNLSTNLPFPGVSWSLTGSATFLLPPGASQAQVVAGAPGTFQLTADITSFAGTTSCGRFVIVSGPSCDVSGPTTALPGAVVSYSVTTALAAPAYSWSLTGDGVLSGPTNGSNVQVTAGAAGAFEVTCGISSSGGSATCGRLCTIATPTCGIQGADRLVEGSALAEFLPTSNITGTSWNWSLSGNGTIVDTSPTGRVRVNVGDPGAFTLTLQVSSASAPPAVCEKTVTVDPIRCALTGPVSVTALTTGLSYSAGPTLLDAVYDWSISGNGTLIGATNGASVGVTAGAAGAFTLTLNLSRHGRATTCSLPVTVTAPSGAPPGRQLQAKMMLHVSGRTAKNPCGRTISSPACPNVVTKGALYPELYFVFLLVGNADPTAGVGGFECGIDYDGATSGGIDIFSWSLCGPSETTALAWPAPGSGNRINWDTATNCQRTESGGPGTGVVAAAGYFYLGAYTPDRLRILPHPQSGAARVVDCDGGESIIEPRAGTHAYPLGYADFSAGGVELGYNPCLNQAVLTEKTSWSAIKALYGN